MARNPVDLGSVSEVYIDETSQTKHRYLVIGGIIVHATLAQKLEDKLAAARLPELPSMELGWTKVSRAKLEAYKRFVDVFFDRRVGVLPLECHSAVVDTSKLKDRLYNDGSRETGFNKEVYQICQKFRRLYGKRLFHIYPDARSTKNSTEELRLILNRGASRSGDARDWPFRRVHFRHSHEWQVLQLVDLLIGAIAFELNGHSSKPDASPAKCELSRHILDQAKVRNPAVSTAISGKFTIWHRELR